MLTRIQQAAVRAEEDEDPIQSEHPSAHALAAAQPSKNDKDDQASAAERKQMGQVNLPGVSGGRVTPGRDSPGVGSLDIETSPCGRKAVRKSSVIVSREFLCHYVLL